MVSAKFISSCPPAHSCFLFLSIILRAIKYLPCMGLFIFWSVFSGAVRLNTEVLDVPVFGLAAGDGDRPFSRTQGSAFCWINRWALRTLWPFTGRAHRTHCEPSASQRCLPRVSPSSSLGAKVVFGLLLWKVAKVRCGGSLGAWADLVPLFCRFPAARGILRRATLEFPDTEPHTSRLIQVVKTQAAIKSSDMKNPT